MGSDGPTTVLAERSTLAVSRKGWRRFVLLLALAAVLAVSASFFQAETASAATITVTTANDPSTGVDGCSLREAITNANNDDTSGSVECTSGDAGPDVIEFTIPAATAGCAAVAPALCTITPATELPTIMDPLEINGFSQGGGGYSGPPLIHLVGTVGLRGLVIIGDDSLIRGLSITGFDSGIEIAVGTGNAVRGNYIGVEPDGLSASSNTIGVFVNSAIETDIGGTTAADRNVISGNSFDGIFFVGICGCPGQESRARGNYIGLDATGTVTVPNGEMGIRIVGGSGIIVGGTADGAGNVISGNTLDGILILGFSAFDNQIYQNKIGTNPGGTAALGNGRDGISLTPDPFGPPAAPGPFDTNIGVAGDGNVISGNGRYGIYLEQAFDTDVRANFVGVGQNGSTRIANLVGIYVDTSPETDIGGSTADRRNVIAGNTNDQVFFTGDCGCFTDPSLLRGNYIGVDATGLAPVTNNANGVQVFNGFNIMIGGVFPGEGNVISGNEKDGVKLTGALTEDVNISGNKIGTNWTGLAAVPNKLNGINVEAENGNPDGPRKSIIGSKDAGAGNLVSGNLRNGIRLHRTRQSTDVIHNLIGVDINGANAIPNGLNGLLIDRANRLFVIENVIANNGQVGVVIRPRSGGGEIGNVLTENQIFNNNGLGIDVTNTLVGDENGNGKTQPDGSTEADGIQNYPVIDQATTSPLGTVVDGSLTSLPNDSYRIELFASPTCDTTAPPPGNGEGRTFMGGFDTATNALGVAEFTKTIGQIPLNHVITATATNINRETSEFSVCTPVTTAKILVEPKSGLTTTEAGGTATFTVALSTLPTANVTIALSSSDTTEGTIPPASSTLTFTPTNGTTAQQVIVTGQPDAIADGNQNYSIVTAAAASGDPVYNGMTVPDVSVTNLDNGLIPTLSIEPKTVVEGTGPNTAMSFTVTLAPASTQTVSVNWKVVNGTAVVNTDIDPADANGIVTFNPGETTKQIIIDVVGDAVPEPTETFTVQLLNAIGAAIGAQVATGTITDDDVAAGPCSPRPNIVMTTQRTGTNQLVVTIKAGVGSLKKITFGSATDQMQNAQVETIGPASVIQGFGVLTPPPNVTQQSFVIRRILSNQPVMVKIVVEDNCGDWKTFVGTGSNPW